MKHLQVMNESFCFWLEFLSDVVNGPQLEFSNNWNVILINRHKIIVGMLLKDIQSTQFREIHHLNWWAKMLSSSEELLSDEELANLGKIWYSELCPYPKWWRKHLGKWWQVVNECKVLKACKKWIKGKLRLAVDRWKAAGSWFCDVFLCAFRSFDKTSTLTLSFGGENQLGRDSSCFRAREYLLH